MEATKCDLCGRFEEGSPWRISISCSNYDVCSDCLEKFKALAAKLREEK